MKEYFDKYPRAWETWLEFSNYSETIDFPVFDDWCNCLGISVGIIEYPNGYTAQSHVGGASQEFGDFETWHEALDAVVEHVFGIVETDIEGENEVLDLYFASKELYISETSKEAILSYYKTLLDDMGSKYRLLQKNAKDGKEMSQEDIDSFDSIIMISIACKRLLIG